MTARYSLLAAGVAIAIGGCATLGRVGVIRYDVMTDAQQAIADTRINAGAMTIEGRVDREDTAYDAGQPITLSVKTSKDAHVAILRVLANGSTTLLFPNRQHPKSDIAANTVLTVPGPDDAVSIKADKPGVVLFEFIASTAGDSWLFTRPADAGSDFADLGGTTRALAKHITDSLKINKGPETVATYLTVKVSK
jgi:hypothetical protein